MNGHISPLLRRRAATPDRRGSASRPIRRGFGAVTTATIWCFAATVCVFTSATAQTIVLQGSNTPNDSGERTILLDQDGAGEFTLAVDGDATVVARLSLGKLTLEGEDSSAFIAFEIGEGEDVTRSAEYPDVSIPPDGRTFSIVTSQLQDRDGYSGKLRASLTSGESYSWDLRIVPQTRIPALLCPASGDTQLVGRDGRVLISLERTLIGGSDELSFELLPFVSEAEQQLAEVTFTDAEPESPTIINMADPGGETFDVSLSTAEMMQAKPYNGAIVVRRAGQTLQRCPLTLVNPGQARATPVLDKNEITKPVTLSFWLGKVTDPWIMTRIYDETRTYPIRGLAMRTDGPSSSPTGSFDLDRYVYTWRLGDTKIRDLTEWDSTDESVRTLPAGSLTVVGMKLKDLSSGAYTFGLRLTALDAEASERQKLAVIVNVKDHPGRALVALTVALVVSWILSKGIVNWRSRIQTRQRIERMRPDSLKSVKQLPSVVWLRAVLAQSRALASTPRMLPPAASIAGYLERADRLVTLLSKAKDVRDAIDDLDCDERVKQHLADAVRDALSPVGPVPLDQATADKILAELIAIQGRFEVPNDWYKQMIVKKGKRLAEWTKDVDVESLGGQPVVDKLVGILEKDPASLDEYDAAYWKLRILRSRRSDENMIPKLAKSVRDDDALEDFFKISDDLIWERIKTTKGAIRILPNQRRWQPVEHQMLEPIQFQLDFNDPIIAESFLVTNLLEYEWDFSLYKKPSRWKKGSGFPAEPTDEWTAETSGPRIAQYAKYEGRLELKVTIRRPKTASSPEDSISLPVVTADSGVDGKTDTNKRGPITILPNSELRLAGLVQGSELLTFALIFVLTLGSGFVTLYLDKPTFGSFADYLALFTWAVGIDQGKNLLQALDHYKSQDAGTS